ncbi:MAG TPA: hypothetical protein VHT24_11140 [Pseudacidobacterium sp.]|jgi:hypothetical protein|nr:hypothetical protein [Pseudacidobacterium sp.]
MKTRLIKTVCKEMGASILVADEAGLPDDAFSIPAFRPMRSSSQLE